jgi:hypothetical protein
MVSVERAKLLNPPTTVETATEDLHHKSRRSSKASATRSRHTSMTSLMYPTAMSCSTLLLRPLGEYVETEYDYAGDYRRGLPDLIMPTINAPGNPDPANMVSVELWKMDIKEHREKLRRRLALDQRVFGLILGQCSRTVRD